VSVTGKFIFVADNAPPIVERLPPCAPGAQAIPSRMQRLKQATRSAHDRIERAFPVFDQSLTLARYAQVVRALYGFYAPLEQLCENVVGPSTPLDLRKRMKLAFLATDLTALGHTSIDIQALPICRALPLLTDASQAMGVLYVLEGATLGGQIIAQRVRHILGIDAFSGAAFFAGYGDQTRAMWMRLAAHVDAMPGLDVATAIVAAGQTFETLGGWLTASRTPP
jgi:heme oxygenase (biliverdin-IX-beta and delta-forming)